MELKRLLIILICFTFTGMTYADLDDNLLDDNLIAHWSFNGNVEDVSGNEHHGEVKGTTLEEALVKDRFWIPDHAFSFDGEDVYIRVPLSNTLDIVTNQISISVWINLTEPFGGYVYPQHYIFDSRDGEGGYAFNADIDIVQFWVGPDPVTFLVNMQSKEWHHLVLTYNRTFATLYVNGEFNSKTYFTEHFIATTGPFWIGQRFNFIERFYGKMDELRIYDRIISEDEIEELYEEEPGPDDPEPEPPEDPDPTVIVVKTGSAGGCFMETIK